MGIYSDRIKAGYDARHLSPADIRAAKCARSHARNLDRKAMRIETDKARHAKTLPENRRQFRRVNKLGEFADKV